MNHLYCIIVKKWKDFGANLIQGKYVLCNFYHNNICYKVSNNKKTQDDILPSSIELKRKRIAQRLLNIVQLTSVCGAISYYLLASVQPWSAN